MRADAWFVVSRCCEMEAEWGWVAVVQGVRDCAKERSGFGRTNSVGLD